MEMEKDKTEWATGDLLHEHTTSYKSSSSSSSCSSLASGEPKLQSQPLHEIPTAVPGFADYTSEDHILFELWKKTLADRYELNGYMSLDLPPFVRKEFLRAKGGISNEIYAISRLQGERMNREEGGLVKTQASPPLKATENWF